MVYIVYFQDHYELLELMAKQTGYIINRDRPEVIYDEDGIPYDDGE